jgi:cell division protein FtsN
LAGKSVQPEPPQTTGSIPRSATAETPASGLVIQAGSFKSKDNADRARNVLGPIASVDVTPIEIGGDVYYRVRVGPFAAASEAKAALVRVTAAGYRGAKMVKKN